MAWSIRLLSNNRRMVATACWLSVLSMIANVGLSVDLVMDAMVPGYVRLLSGLMASQSPSLMSTIWVLISQVL